MADKEDKIVRIAAAGAIIDVEPGETQTLWGVEFTCEKCKIDDVDTSGNDIKVDSKLLFAKLPEAEAKLMVGAKRAVIVK